MKSEMFMFSYYLDQYDLFIIMIRRNSRLFVYSHFEDRYYKAEEYNLEKINKFYDLKSLGACLTLLCVTYCMCSE